MDYKQRYKKQAEKIDILCNDLIAAQRDFIRRLRTISFAANFCESIVGMTDLSTLLYTAGKLIRDEIGDVKVSFFLRGQESFELHMFESDQPITLEKRGFENCFSSELVDGICKSNKVCTLDDMFSMGLEGDLSVLNQISAITIPLGQLGRSQGFVLIYRRSVNRPACRTGGFTVDELNNISAITAGLSRAIQSCQALLQSVD
jgi:hypothetical protein